ncbi:MAG: hypothetical protein NC548_45015 [Lachnospiraceae bacterium]|nr:hypothetical protein [Lachnospiraceae bacterium]
MLNQLIKIEAIRDYSQYSLEDLKKLRTALMNEYRSYFKSESKQKLHNALQLYNISRVNLKSKYERMIQLLEYKINSKLGAYNLYDISNPANRSIRRTIENYFALAKRYKTSLNIELTIRERTRYKDYNYFNTTDIYDMQDMLRLIKLACDSNRDRKYLEIDINVYWYVGNNDIHTYYKTFKKAERTAK